MNLSVSRYDAASIVRIPGYRPSSEAAARIELRNPDPASNPYLAFACMLAAGLKGIEDELELPDPVEKGATADQVAQRGVGRLPESLGEAIALFEHSELMKETLGEHIHSYLIKHKRDEWHEYQASITPWELDRYLAVL